MALLFIEINPGNYVCQKLTSTLLLKKKPLQPKEVQKHILTPVEKLSVHSFQTETSNNDKCHPHVKVTEHKHI